MTPSDMRLCKSPAGSNELAHVLVLAKKWSISSIGILAAQKISAKSESITIRKTTTPATGCVKMSSSFSVHTERCTVAASMTRVEICSVHS